MLTDMAREESKREDLLREATALIERIELAPAGDPPAEHVVVGFRAEGALSVFFGSDPVYQFNTAGQLRRAFCDGLLFKAVRGRLVSLRRERGEHEVQLLRHELSDDEQTGFLSQMGDRLQRFILLMETGRITIVGQVPPDVDILDHVRAWFVGHDPMAIAKTPHVRAATQERCG